jgi:hypothetical protein
MLWVISLKKDFKNLLLIIVFVFVLGISINVYADTTTCSGLFSNGFIEDLKKYVYVPIKWATPILLILLTSIDFATVVFGGKKDSMDKAKNNFMKRLVAALIIFFAPDVISLLVDFVQQQSISSCMNKLK